MEKGSCGNGIPFLQDPLSPVGLAGFEPTAS